MFVSLHLSPQSRSEPEDIERIDELVEQAVRADRAGVASVALTEHHLGGFNSYCDPFPLASHLAGKLSQAYVAIHVVQAPLAHPVRMAEQCNLLDVLTRGRSMVAFATGSVRQIELDAFGVSVEARSDMTTQRLDAMLRAWSWSDDASPVDVSTDYDVGTLAGRLTPSSYRKPHPLIGRATLTLPTIIDTARRGLPLILATPDRDLASLYRDTLENAGHDDETVSECLDWNGFIIAASLARTVDEAEARLERYLEGGGSGPIVTAADEGSLEWVREWRQRQATKKAISIPVTPEMLVERLSAVKDLGVNHVRVHLAEIPGEHEQNAETFDLFIEEVLPYLSPERLRDPARTVSSVAEERAGTSTG